MKNKIQITKEGTKEGRVFLGILIIIIGIIDMLWAGGII